MFQDRRNSFWSSLFAPRIDRIVFAATKADHLHHTSHDRLEAILALLTEGAMARAKYAGAEVKVLALGRSARDDARAMAKRNGESLPCIVGYPLPGETIGGGTSTATRISPSSPAICPTDPETCASTGRHAEHGDMRFVRFRPPDPVPLPSGGFAPFPNIRLDRALQALIGDRLA